MRTLLGLPVTDLGFFFDWLILDMIPNEPMTFDPPAWQLCDPKRPHAAPIGGAPTPTGADRILQA